MNIFAGTEPPAWLTRMTEQKPGQLGHIIGELVGGLADSTEIAIQTADEKTRKGEQTNWIKELPGSIKPGLAEARLNAQNPLWRMQAQQAQLNMAQQGLQMQNEQSLIDSRKTRLQMQAHDQQVLPEWLHSHPTWESRQDAQPPELFTTEGQRMFHDVQMSDAKSTQSRAFTEGVSAYSKGVTELQKLDPMAAAPFAAQIGKVPTPQLTQALANATAQAQTKASVAKEPKSATIKLGNGTEIQGWYDGKGFHQVKPTEEPKPTTLTMGDGSVVQGYMVNGTFHEVKPAKPEAKPKLSDSQKSELAYAKKEVERLNALIDDPTRKPQLDSLRTERVEAERYYRRLLKQDEEVTHPPAKAPANVGTNAPAPKTQASAGAGVRQYDPDTKSLKPVASPTNAPTSGVASPAAASTATSADPSGAYQRQLVSFFGMKDSKGRTLTDVVKGMDGDSFTHDQEAAVDEHPGFKAMLKLLKSLWDKEQ